jgi:hypothetical protein
VQGILRRSAVKIGEAVPATGAGKSLHSNAGRPDDFFPLSFSVRRKLPGSDGKLATTSTPLAAIVLCSSGEAAAALNVCCS